MLLEVVGYQPRTNDSENCSGSIETRRILAIFTTKLDCVGVNCCFQLVLVYVRLVVEQVLVLCPNLVCLSSIHDCLSQSNVSVQKTYTTTVWMGRCDW